MILYRLDFKDSLNGHRDEQNKFVFLTNVAVVSFISIITAQKTQSICVVTVIFGSTTEKVAQVCTIGPISFIFTGY